MEREQNSGLIWIDGDALVRKDGERMVDYELNGGGYTAKLKAFIAKREQALAEFEKKYKNQVSKQKISSEIEPCM